MTLSRIPSIHILALTTNYNERYINLNVENDLSQTSWLFELVYDVIPHFMLQPTYKNLFKYFGELVCTNTIFYEPITENNVVYI